MKKNLFLAGALALFSFVGVSAQDWCHTVVNGLPGTDVKTTMEDGTEVTNRYAETQVFSHAGTKSIRMTVLQTGSTNQIKGGGPTWNLAELKIYDGNGKEIAYTATSNADHNTMGGAGNDGAGLPALNDGNLNNYWHSTWSAQAPNEYHYLEFELAETVDAFSLAWWNRPNNNNNCPIVVGLTPGGKYFTEDMKFSEYGFELGEQVTSADGLVAGTYAFYVEGPTVAPNDESVTGPGNVFVSLSGYNTGNAQTAGPEHIVQFIPGSKEGTFVLYQPVLGTYYAQPDRWADYNEGQNGWQRAYAEARVLAEFEFAKRPDGDFEMTTYSYYEKDANGNLVKRATPVKLWVGYDMRGNLKVFPEAVKVGLENGDYTLGFGLPVDFGFTIYKAGVADGMVPNKTAAEMCEEVLAGPLETAEAALEKYADIIDDYDWDDAAGALEEAFGAAERAIENGDLAAASEAKDMLEAATALLAAQKANYYEELHGDMTNEYNANRAVPPYKQADSGKYTPLSGEILAQIKALFDEVLESDGSLSYSQIETKWTQIESLIEQFYASTLKFSNFPEIVEGISDANFPYAELPNNAVWKQNVVLAGAVKGIRLTFLDRYIGSAGDGGNFPMIALGEFKLYDADGVEVVLTAENFYANHTETQEGFESTVARLCDGNFGAQGYYHSPWSGAEPQEYIYLDVTFPAEMDNFTFEVYSRDRTTSQNKVSLFPKKVAMTEKGIAYDPLLFAENPYNVAVGEQVTAVDQLTDGIYVVKGLLNTQAVWKEVTEGEGDEATTVIKQVEPTGTAKFYSNTTERFHSAAAAVREASVFRITKNADGTYTMLNLAKANYWPTTEGEAGERNGFVAGTYSQADAAKLNIVASTNIENTFVIYEKVDGLVTVADSIDTNEDGVADAEGETFQTPYVLYMDWSDGLATRPVVDPQPVATSATLADNWGDAKCFTKENGEAEWEIYKVDMENPDFCWLAGLVGIVDNLGIVVGDDPGCVSDLGALEAVLPAAQKVLADSIFADAPAAAAALAKEIAIVGTLEKNPMMPGIYQVVSANVDFKNKQNKEKALYATVDESGTPTFGWKDLAEGDIQFYFDFQKSENAADLVEGGLNEEYKDLVYTIRAISTYEGATPYYIGEADDQSTQIDLFGDAASDYVIKNVKGSAFSIGLYKNVDIWTVHANGHNSGAGQSGNIVYWNGDAGASQWYLRKVDYETSIDDLVTEGTEVVSVAYYTTAGAAIPAPAKGINVVVTVYANGVVETKKVLVK